VRLRRGMNARGNCLAGHHEVGGQAARGGRRGWRKAIGVSRHSGEDASDNRGPVVRETRERRPTQEGANRKGKRIFREDATDARARWAGWDDFGPRGRRGRWAGWARVRTGRKVGRAESIKNWIFEFTKALEICRRRFRRNFDMRIFRKFF
jgi:hypothetical protein